MPKWRELGKTPEALVQQWVTAPCWAVRVAGMSNPMHAPRFGVLTVRHPGAGLACAAVFFRRLALVVLLFSGFVLRAEAARAGSARSADGHLVRWDDGLDAMGESAARQIPLIGEQVAAALGFPLRGGPAEVVIVQGHARMQAESSPTVPEWAGGVCQGARSRIVLRADLVEGYGVLRSMVTTLRHEWVHLTWSRRAGQYHRRLPLWLEEGLAEEIGGGISVDGGVQLDFAAAFGKLIPFPEIRESWPSDAGRAALAYRAGASCGSSAIGVDGITCRRSSRPWPTAEGSAIVPPRERRSRKSYCRSQACP